MYMYKLYLCPVFNFMTTKTKLVSYTHLFFKFAFFNFYYFFLMVSHRQSSEYYRLTSEFVHSSLSLPSWLWLWRRPTLSRNLSPNSWLTPVWTTQYPPPSLATLLPTQLPPLPTPRTLPTLIITLAENQQYTNFDSDFSKNKIKH